jgi:hypothetical protein
VDFPLTPRENIPAGIWKYTFSYFNHHLAFELLKAWYIRHMKIKKPARIKFSLKKCHECHSLRKLEINVEFLRWIINTNTKTHTETQTHMLNMWKNNCPGQFVHSQHRSMGTWHHGTESQLCPYCLQHRYH